MTWMSSKKPNFLSVATYEIIDLLRTREAKEYDVPAQTKGINLFRKRTVFLCADTSRAQFELTCPLPCSPARNLITHTPSPSHITTCTRSMSVITGTRHSSTRMLE